MQKNVDNIYPFQGWKVSLIASDRKKMQPFKNIIHSGRGEVVGWLGKECLKEAQFDETTHVIMNLKFTLSVQYSTEKEDLFEKFKCADLKPEVVATGAAHKFR